MFEQWGQTTDEVHAITHLCPSIPLLTYILDIVVVFFCVVVHLPSLLMCEVYVMCMTCA